MTAEPGQVAYEARFAHVRHAILPWDELPDEARAIWRRVEIAVLAAAHRLQVVAEAWQDDRTDITVARPEPAGQDLAVPQATPPALLANADRLPGDPPPPEAPVFRASGNACRDCGSLAMVRTGTCETCQDCGSTSGGCS